jgi:hypothetical protein
MRGWLGGVLGGRQAVAPPAETAPPALQPGAERPLAQQPDAEAAGCAGAGSPRSSPLRGPLSAAAAPPRRSPRRALPGRLPAGLGAQLPGAGPRAPRGLDGEEVPLRSPTARSLAALRASEERGLAEQLRALGMPTGPWRTDHSAKAEISVWARDRSAAGGSFSVVFSGSSPAQGGRSARGCLHTLICHNHAVGNGKCTWALTLEECQEGWAVRSFHPHGGADSGHSHPLIQTVIEARARSSMRDIPADLVELGKA